nr:hypothetical protein [Plantactinospora sp. KBS50]
MDSDLDPAEVGIVGDPSHKGGYHCGSDRVVTNDYSVVESPRDRSGLTIYASALDVGWFEIRTASGLHNLRTFSTWCVTQCRANTADTADLREIIYSPDGKTVRRWDRLGKRTTGDSSHLWHTHFSYFRDATKANRDLRPLYTRYLTDIGLIAPPTPPEAEMQQSDKLLHDTGWSGRTVGHVFADLQNLRNWFWTPIGGETVGPPADGSPAQLLAAMAKSYPDLVAKVNDLVGRDPTAQAIVEGVLAGLSPEEIAAAIPPTVAQQVVDELAARLAAAPSATARTAESSTAAPAGAVPPPR